ncbi:hypothetical protein BV898_08434 [Hypsibius exemplaris]|uniref:Uncharacterized protein n=1 Tax=Hypsibius exemplaris TaxID=2072580 RepID=A0A1W0WQM1_HYPEX|nr:hypothetical protein BV898_08434 [Hypsibius exemplaris]
MAEHVHFNDLVELQAQSASGIGIQLEIVLEALEKKLDHVITERTDLTHTLNVLVQEIAVIDGETATKTAEIAERAANLLDVGAVITQVKDKACAYALEAKVVKQQVQAKLDDAKASLMDGKNRLERVRGALLDLYAEQLVLKASFLAYAGSLKGMTKKTRITREMNEQTHQMLKDIGPLKSSLHGLRESISAFKTQTAEASVKLHDRIMAEREQRFTEAKEQKYLVLLYEEESQILDRLDTDLKLQLDSALAVAGQLQHELKEHETYFQNLQDRLKTALKTERSGASSVLASIMRSKKPTGMVVDLTAPKPLDMIERLCPACGFIGKYCSKCNVKTLFPGMKKQPPQQDVLIDMENRRSAMKAQLKYLEHKLQQLEIEVYISKMNVEIQMLQTSIKIEGWKKNGFVPASLQISAVDTSAESAPKMRPMMAAFAATGRVSGSVAGGVGAFAKFAKGKNEKVAGMAGISAVLTAAQKTAAEQEAPKRPTLPALQAV